MFFSRLNSVLKSRVPFGHRQKRQSRSSVNAKSLSHSIQLELNDLFYVDNSPLIIPLCPLTAQTIYLAMVLYQPCLALSASKYQEIAYFSLSFFILLQPCTKHITQHRILYYHIFINCFKAGEKSFDSKSIKGRIYFPFK